MQNIPATIKQIDRTEARARVLEWTALAIIVLDFTLCVLTAIYQHYLVYRSNWEPLLRFVHVIEDRTAFAMFLCLFIPFILLGLAWSVPQRRIERERRKRLRRLILYFGLVNLAWVIVLPNFFYSSRDLCFLKLRNDFRLYAKAIEAYRIDHGAYPAWTVDMERTAGVKLPTVPSFRLPRFGESFDTLTTPVAYLKRFYWGEYVFREVPTTGSLTTFAYKVCGEPPNESWILYCAGMDMDFDIDLTQIDRIYSLADTGPSDGLIARTYDPTNGTLSNGDIWRVSQGFRSPDPK